MRQILQRWVSITKFLTILFLLAPSIAFSQSLASIDLIHLNNFLLGVTQTSGNEAFVPLVDELSKKGYPLINITSLPIDQSHLKKYDLVFGYEQNVSIKFNIIIDNRNILFVDWTYTFFNFGDYLKYIDAMDELVSSGREPYRSTSKLPFARSYMTAATTTNVYIQEKTENSTVNGVHVEMPTRPPTYIFRVDWESD
jgi:hypothetical protein